MLKILNIINIIFSGSRETYYSGNGFVILKVKRTSYTCSPIVKITLSIRRIPHPKSMLEKPYYNNKIQKTYKRQHNLYSLGELPL